MEVTLTQTSLNRVTHLLQYVPNSSATDLEYLIRQLGRIAVQLVEAVRVSISALVRRGLFAPLSRLQVLAIFTGRTCRWDA